jgi:nucleoside-diphosphate-sugar epimerase
VYGWAVHRGATEDEVTPAPATPVSRSRVRAERAILDVGGIVLRPLFVYGDGDTRFVPVVLRALRRLPFLIDRGEARISVVCVDDLAAAISALATIPGSGVSGAFHISDGRPVAFRDLVQCLSQAVAVRLPRWSLPYPLARLVMRAGAGHSGGLGVWSESVAHRLFLVARDHYYDSSAIWSLTGLQPGQPLEGRVEDLARWYGDRARYARQEGPEEPTGTQRLWGLREGR